jgi:D-alanyl-D-alanine dipeptidase
MTLKTGIYAFVASAFALAMPIAQAAAGASARAPAGISAQAPAGISSTAISSNFTQTLDDARLADIRRALSAAVEQERSVQMIPSVAIGIVDTSGRRWQGAFGFSDAARARPADVHDLYRVGRIGQLGLLDTLKDRRPASRSKTSAPPVYADAEMAPYDDVRSTVPTIQGVTDLYRYESVETLSDTAVALLRRPSLPTSSVRIFDGHRAVDYEASSLGHVTAVSLYPDDGFAVVVLVALDSAFPAERRLRDFAVRSILAGKSSGATPQYPAPSSAVPESIARAIAGHYANGASTLEVRIVEGRTYLEAPDVAAELRRAGDRWALDDVLTARDDVAVDAAAGDITLAGVTYHRALRPKPAPPDAELARLIGTYGTELSYLRIYERDGRAYVRIGPSDYEPLQRISSDVYSLAQNSKRQLRIERAQDGMPQSIRFDGRSWPRSDFGAEKEAKLHASVRQVPGLRENAWKAAPPAAEPGKRAPELVEVARLEPGIKLDIRYATTNNLMGLAVYDEPRAFLQKPAAEALVRAHERLGKEHGFGILIHDTYRPWAVTKIFWDATPPSEHDFVADPAKGSKHNRGCAADITLYDRATGETLEMTGRYDETSARSIPLYVGGSSLQRWRRDVLKDALEAEGFAVYRYEWWHFDHHLWTEYPIMNVKFRDVPPTAAAAR